MTKLKLLVVILILFPSFCHAWNYDLNFESGQITGQADSWSSIDNVHGGQTIIDSTKANTGTHSSKSILSAGSGELDLRKTINTLSQGQSIWIRVYLTHEPGFNWGPYNSGSSIRKGIRLGSPIGGDQIGPRSGNIEITTEDKVGTSQTRYNTGFPLSQFTVTDRWLSWEVACTNIGTADERYYAWFDGVNYLNVSNQHNTAAISSINFFDNFNDYMNAGTLYIDDVYITNETPAKQDVQGNYMIGPISCENGRINGACYCNGQIFNTGYCCNGIYQQNVCGIDITPPAAPSGLTIN